MPIISSKSSSLAAALGETLNEAVLRHRNDPTFGPDDTAPVLTPRADLRSLAALLSIIQHDTPERSKLLKLAGVDGISPRQVQEFSNHLLKEVDREEASAAFDRPWDKAPWPNRNELPPLLNGFSTRRLSEVIPLEPDWVWEQRIVRGNLNLICGDPNLGKTWAVLDICARITTGRGFIDAPSSFKERRDVLFVSAEDSDAHTIRPRFDLLGGDPTRFHTFQGVYESRKEKTFNLATHLAQLGHWLFSHPLVSLLVLDPISAYLGKLDSHNNTDVRGVIGPFTKLAEKHNVAIVGVTHLNKGEGDKAIYRSMGSMGFVAAARSAWMVTADPEQKDRRLFTKIKANLQTKDVGGLAFRLGEHVPGVLKWEPEPVHTTADETLRVVSGGKDQTKAPARAEAKEWLRELLNNGPVLAAEIWERAKADGMAEKTVKLAKKELEIRTDKTGGPGDPWVWSLPKSKS